MGVPTFGAEGRDLPDRILDSLTRTGALFDCLRVLDPVARSVVERQADGGRPPPNRCMGFWSDEPACRSCVAALAFRENRRKDRLETLRGRIWLMSAFPVQDGGRGLVVETLRDLGGTLVTSGGEPIDAVELQAALDQVERGMTIDPATGLLDRRSIDERLPREVARARSTRYPLSLALVSVDGFAGIRSRSGDRAAVDVARRIGEALKTGLRSEQDWVARAGEDAFLVVMRNTGLAGLRTVAERLRARIARVEAPHGERSAPVTATVALHVEMPAKPTQGPILALLERKVQEAALAGGDRIV